MKLKTLKDFEDYSKHQTGNRMLEKVKQEAIKWVKDIRDSVPSTSKKKEDIRCFSESFIKHFHNITEEDLR